MLRRTLLGTCALVMTLGLGLAAAEAAYPERPITIIVPWSAGGGTDATGRILASLMEAELGQPVNVVNRTGGSGVVGHSAIATAEPDGYTLGIVTVEIGMMHWAGLTDLTHEDYTPLVLYNEDPAGLQVRSDADWDSVDALLAFIRDNPPGTLKASGTGQGGIWHLALAGMLQTQGIDWRLGAWRGVAGPKGMPAEVVDTLVPLLEKIHASDEFREFMTQRGFGMIFEGPEGYRQFMAESNESLGGVMKELGLAQ